MGKTAIVVDFGQAYFPEMLKVDLERNQAAAAVFRNSVDPVEIIERLQLITKTKLSRAGLLFIDEIHSCPSALTALKYFAEELPGQAVIAAGSHLGILLAGILTEERYSFPVGQVEFMELPPIDFDEFVQFRGDREVLLTAQRVLFEEASPGGVPEALHIRLWDLWKEYLVTGGLPQVIIEFAAGQQSSLLEGFDRARVKQSDLLTAYEADLAKHSGKVNAQHIIRILRALPAKLATVPEQNTQRFTFKDVVPGVRGYDRLSGAIDWLTSSGIAIRVPTIKEPLQPLKAFADEHLFKLFLFDVGLLGALAGIDPASVYSFNFGMYKGCFAESFVLQELAAALPANSVVSWYTNQAEVEFLIDTKLGIIPIEVKSSAKFRARSLASYEKRFSPKFSLVLSAKMGGRRDQRREIPLYLAGGIKRLLNA